MNRNLLGCFILMIFHFIAAAQQLPILTITSSGVKYISAEIDNLPFFNSVLVQDQNQITAVIELGLMLSISVDKASNYTQDFSDIKVQKEQLWG